MRHASFAVAVILLSSFAIFAQHSSGGGGGGGGSSSGGSHGGGGGGGSSASSSGGHSSSSGGGSHSSSSHSGGGSTSSNSGARGSQSNALHSVHNPVGGQQTTIAPEKRGFFSLLRHHAPVKPGPEPVKNVRPVPDLRHWACAKGVCQACPVGQASNGRGGCGGAYVANNGYFCSRFGLWGSGSCLQHTGFLSDCTGLRMSMERQAERTQEAESARQNSCSAGATQECSDSTSRYQSESSLYDVLQQRYRQCGVGSMGAFGGVGFGSYSRGYLSDPLMFDASYR